MGFFGGGSLWGSMWSLCLSEVSLWVSMGLYGVPMGTLWGHYRDPMGSLWGPYGVSVGPCGALCGLYVSLRCLCGSL